MRYSIIRSTRATKALIVELEASNMDMAVACFADQVKVCHEGEEIILTDTKEPRKQVRQYYSATAAEREARVERAFASWIEGEVEACTKRITKTLAELGAAVADSQKSVDYNFRWMDGDMEAGARLQLARRLSALHTGGESRPGMSLPALLEYVTGETLQKARDGSASTSTSHNLYMRYELMAYAAGREKLAGLVSWLEKDSFAF